MGRVHVHVLTAVAGWIQLTQTVERTSSDTDDAGNPALAWLGKKQRGRVRCLLDSS
jgi:hypothetical protein